MRSLPLLLLAACASRAAAPRATTPAAPPVRTVELEPMRIDVVATPEGQETRAYDARSLLDDGNAHLLLHRYDPALAAYEHLLRDFPDSRLVVPALFNTGQALEGKEDWKGAAERYRRLLEAAPVTDETRVDRKNASFRLAAVLAEIGDFAGSAAAIEKVLGWDDLAPEERIEALARLGFALLEMKDHAGAEEVLRQALAYHRDIQGTHRLESPYFVAMAQFYLGEIPRRQFAAIPLRYPEEQMRRDVEQKSQLFLLARDRYVKTVEYKSPYWATAAVFQVAAMYREFWDHWMAVPIPAGFSGEEAREYTRRVNSEPELRRLLEKALYFHEKNVALARDAGISTGWSQESASRADEVRQLLARQQRGEQIVPGRSTPMPPLTPAPMPGVEPATPAATGGYIPGRFEL
jgi:tetratricopeptide (TPR) repeat protein